MERKEGSDMREEQAGAVRGEEAFGRCSSPSSRRWGGATGERKEAGGKSKPAPTPDLCPSSI